MIVTAALFAGSCVSDPRPDPSEIEAVATTAPATATSAPGSTIAPLPDRPEPGTDLVCWQSTPPTGRTGISFEDVTADAKLIEPLTGMHGHAAAWGDPNSDGRPDLLVGTFGDRPIEKYQVRGATGPSPDTLLVGGPPFQVGNRPDLQIGRTSGAVFADLDGDGDDDLVLSRNAGLSRQSDVPSVVFANRNGLLTPLDGNGMPTDLLGRSVGVLDADQDGLLDLLIVEDRYGNMGTRLLRNTGDLQFEDATAVAGIPDEVLGLGIATGDLNDDGLTDFFIGGSNRLFISEGSLRFHEVRSPVFEWEFFGNEDEVAGAALGDVNRDGRPDLVVGHHFNSTIDFGEEVAVRLYLHGGLDAEGDPIFADATEVAGLIGLPTKAPHVEIEDVDNDGWPDIVSSASAENGERPAIFHNEGLVDGQPHFSSPTGLGDPQYWVAGPMADFDRDGLLDIFLVEWEPSLPSLLLRNVSAAGNWLEVSFDLPGNGVGAVVSVFEANSPQTVEHLLGRREIVVSEGYTVGVLPYAHFGLGTYTTVDVIVQLPLGEMIELNGIEANRHIRLPGGCDE